MTCPPPAVTASDILKQAQGFQQHAMHGYAVLSPSAL